MKTVLIACLFALTAAAPLAAPTSVPTEPPHAGRLFVYFENGFEKDFGPVQDLAVRGGSLTFTTSQGVTVTLVLNQGVAGNTVVGYGVRQ